MSRRSWQRADATICGGAARACDTTIASRRTCAVRFPAARVPAYRRLLQFYQKDAQDSMRARLTAVYALTAVGNRVWPVGLLPWDCRDTDFARLELADRTPTEVENNAAERHAFARSPSPIQVHKITGL